MGRFDINRTWLKGVTAARNTFQDTNGGPLAAAKFLMEPDYTFDSLGNQGGPSWIGGVTRSNNLSLVVPGQIDAVKLNRAAMTL